jgi:hypothetical protein
MSKAAMTCPFSNKACTECPIYRGRHRYRSFSHQCQDSTDKATERAKSALAPSIEFETLKKSVERYLVLPTFPNTNKHNERPEIKLKVIDVETKTTRTCDFDETKEWIWDNPEIMRIIDGWQVTSTEMLLEILCDKADKGCKEVELYEAPRFMLLAGG